MITPLEFRGLTNNLKLDYLARGAYRFNWKRISNLFGHKYVCDCTWVYGYPMYFKNDKGQFHLIADDFSLSAGGVIDPRCRLREVVPGSIQLFSHCYDQFGSPIFEGDIVFCSHPSMFGLAYVCGGSSPYIQSKKDPFARNPLDCVESKYLLVMANRADNLIGWRIEY